MRQSKSLLIHSLAVLCAKSGNDFFSDRANDDFAQQRQSKLEKTGLVEWEDSECDFVLTAG